NPLFGLKGGYFLLSWLYSRLSIPILAACSRIMPSSLVRNVSLKTKAGLRSGRTKWMSCRRHSSTAPLTVSMSTPTLLHLCSQKSCQSPGTRRGEYQQRGNYFL
uniref:Uncharacterized protein n=1 Tax=Chelonoidis abingdonii TaxID=106734 RepID=A0A8C0G7V5_CHEAB